MPPFNPSKSPSPSPPTLPVSSDAISNGAGIRKRQGVATTRSSAASASSATTIDGTISSSSKKLLNIHHAGSILHPTKQLNRLGEALAGPSRAIAPIAIIGGTISVYSSAIQHSNNADFTPLSILYLLLLALNYAIMPRLSKRYIHPNTNKQSVALAEEVVKMSLGLGGWVLSSYVTASKMSNTVMGTMDSSLVSDTTTAATVSSVTMTASILSQQLEHWSPLSTLIAAGLPSALYALQGTLTYTAYQNLDSVTFNGLTQLKVLSSALCCYIVLNKKQSLMQLCALGLLMMSTVIFQGSWKEWFGANSASPSTAANDNKNDKNNRRFLLGVLPCLVATLLSGLAGAFSQRSLQTQVGGMAHRDAYFYTVEISFLSAVCFIPSMLRERWKGHRDRASGTAGTNAGEHDTSSNSFFQHWTYVTLLPITTKATAGLLTALVHRHLGSVIKGFALVLGLVFSALLQFVLEGVDLTFGQLVGTALVLFSSWLHFTNST